MRLLLRFSGLVIGFCATCEGHLNALPSLNAHRHLRGSISWQAVEPGDTIRPGAARESTGSEPRLIGSNGGVSIHRGGGPRPLPCLPRAHGVAFEGLSGLVARARRGRRRQGARRTGGAAPCCLSRRLRRRHGIR